jgi:hypothetical protein
LFGMTVSRLLVIALIFVFTGLAWFILGASVNARTDRRARVAATSAADDRARRRPCARRRWSRDDGRAAPATRPPFLPLRVQPLTNTTSGPAPDVFAQVQAEAATTWRSPAISTTSVRGSERLRAWCDGFSLHAAVVIADHDRDALERLCRYGARPAFAQDRLAWTTDGRISYPIAARSFFISPKLAPAKPRLFVLAAM